MSGHFYVKNLGCKVNKVESDFITRQLQLAGATLAKPSQADVILINTCTVTAEADSKSRKAARQAAAKTNEPWVIITGCGVIGDAEQFADLGDKILMIADKSKAASKAIELLCRMPSVFASTTNPSRYVGAIDNRPRPTSSESQWDNCPVPFVSTSSTTRVGIKVQDGCDNRCAFCIVSFVRGPAKSVPLQEVVDRCNSALQHGSKELVLTGINLGHYNSDQKNLSALLEVLLPNLKRIQARVRLSSIEPPELTDELLDLIASSDGHICAHLHLPLQSGSNRVLQAMGRKYDTEFYLSKIEAAKKLLSNLALSTDVIVGFPGETEQDFAQTVEVCKQAGFMQIHVFKYSKRAGTAAAGMPNQVPAAIANQRSKQLREIAAHLRDADAQTRVGQSEQVLAETTSRGRSESYYPVKLPSGCKKGELTQMTFTGYSDGMLTV